MAIFLQELTEWADVERVAAHVGVVTCIRKNGSDIGPNNGRAEQTWQEHYPGALRYFAIRNGDKDESPEGYIRIVRLNESGYISPQTWGVDFAKPMDYGVLLALAKQLAPWVLLAKKSESSLAKNTGGTANWPVISAAYPQLAKYPYRIQTPGESSWLVVPRE
jgi:hypothetical protein